MLRYGSRIVFIMPPGNKHMHYAQNDYYSTRTSVLLLTIWITADHSHLPAHNHKLVNSPWTSSWRTMNIVFPGLESTDYLKYKKI